MADKELGEIIAECILIKALRETLVDEEEEENESLCKENPEG